MTEEEKERLVGTLTVLAMNVAGLRARIEALEQTRWARFREWFRAYVYDGTLVFTHSPYDRREL